MGTFYGNKRFSRATNITKILLSSLLLFIGASASPTKADVIFVGTSGPYGGNVTVGPNTDLDETSGFPAMDLKVTPTQMILTMTKALSVTANTFWGEDSASVKFEQIVYDAGLGYSGSGSTKARLSYTIQVGGSYSGEGDQADAQTKIHGKIGNFVDHVFSSSDSEPSDGDFNKLWGIPAFAGSFLVTPGAGFVAPSFGIDEWELTATSNGWAKMTNTWSSASITMTLEQIPEPASIWLLALGIIANILLGDRPRITRKALPHLPFRADGCQKEGLLCRRRSQKSPDPPSRNAEVPQPPRSAARWASNQSGCARYGRLLAQARYHPCRDASSASSRETTTIPAS